MTATLPPLPSRPPGEAGRRLRVVCCWPFMLLAVPVGILTVVGIRALRFVFVTMLQVLGPPQLLGPPDQHRDLVGRLQGVVDWVSGVCVGCRQLRAEMEDTEHYLSAWRCECGRPFFDHGAQRPVTYEPEPPP